MPAETKFVCFEPMLEEIKDPDLTDIDWVIMGGETGKKARASKEHWYVNLRKYCKDRGIPVFFHSVGDKFKGNKGKFCGKKWRQYPLKFNYTG